MVVKPSAYAIVLQDGEILVVYAGRRWHLPGGGMDEGESPEDAVVREVMEETGYPVVEMAYAGQGKQLFETGSVLPGGRIFPGPDLLKIGFFFVISVGLRVEGRHTDHPLRWMDPREFLSRPADAFHHNAVRQVLGL